MISHPTAAELVQAVAQFEARVSAGPSGRDAFLARVATNARALIEREETQGASAEAAAIERLETLLDHDGTFADLNAELCDRLASGQLDLASPGVFEHLKASAIDQLLIDQPTYSGLAALRGDA